MSVSVDLAVLHLLCSRLCHDLVGPVGAISNGLELMREFGAQDDESMELVGDSAAQLSARLQLFRVAYGMASGAARSVADVRGLVKPWCETEGITLDWPPGGQDGTALSLTGIKLVLNTALLAKECLVRDGGLSVSLVPEGGEMRMTLVAAGPGARVKEEVAEGLSPDLAVDALTPRNVQGYFTRILARAAGGDLDVSSEPDRVGFVAPVPLEA